MPKRIFLSYGHDEYASLAIRLRDDLKRRGHGVWFDEERLKPGQNWEANIEKGLEYLAADKPNAAIVLLLTPHSVRRPDGYCLNEVARAVSRGLRIIPVMVADCEPPLSICRVQWLDMRACVPIEQKSVVYSSRFQRLVKAIEENELDFEGTQQRIIKALQPLEFDADILRHTLTFTGRQWVFDRLDAWVAQSSPAERIFWISGGPGVGKTALAAVLASRYPEVAAVHFCKFGHAQKSDPRCVVTSLVYQLGTQLPEYEHCLATMDFDRMARGDACTVFDNLLVQPLTRLTQHEHPIIILIDALDEASSGEKNDLANFIRDEFSKTPVWLRLIITSRPESAVTVPLQAYHPFILDVEAEANRTDIRHYLQRELASLLQGRRGDNHLLDGIMEKSEGVFLYAKHVCDDLRKAYLSLDRLDDFPRGLGGVFSQFFDRQFLDREKFRNSVRPALRVILAAREPLPVDILQQLFNWEDEELYDFTRILGSLFLMILEGGQHVIKVYHKSLADWLTDEEKAGAYFVSMQTGHRIIGDFCLQQWERGSVFAISEVVYHLQFVRKSESLVALLRKPAYYEMKIAKCGIEKLYEDLRYSGAVLGNAPAITPIDDCLPEVRALFAIAALISFSRELSAGPAITDLDRFIRSGCNDALLTKAREELNSKIREAELERRLPEVPYDHFSTLHYYPHYVECWLKAQHAALTLRLGEMIELFKSALRYYAIYSCNGDPIGAVHRAIEEEEENLAAKLSILQNVALRLNVAIAKRENIAGRS